jgi:RNA polymerase sigma-70 factor (ECF subfamily)
MDETLLVKQAQEGSDDAFGRLVEAYQSQVYNLAYRMLRQRQEAEDAAQETFLRAFRRLSTYTAGQRFGSWLLSIAAHYCVDQLRRRRFLWLSLDDVPFIGSLVSRAPQPESAALASEQRDEVAVLLQCLPSRYRLVTVLRYMHDLSIAEIAAIVGSTEGTVKTQLSRSRDLLAAEVQRQAPTDQASPFKSATVAPGDPTAHAGRPRSPVQEVALQKEDIADALRRPCATDAAIGR